MNLGSLSKVNSGLLPLSLIMFLCSKNILAVAKTILNKRLDKTKFVEIGEKIHLLTNKRF